MRIIRKLAAASIAGVVTASLLTAGVAHADIGEGRIQGAGDVSNDLHDEGTLSRTSFAHSNATAVLQILLWSQDLLPGSGVDCSFGPTTENAVKALQRRLNSVVDAGLTVDGKAGPATFTAFSRLESIGIDANGRIDLGAWSSRRTTEALRRQNNVWQIRANSGWVEASYRSASAC